jgi:very-short-patch-repair endonuclease
LDTIKEKTKKTNLKKYGVEYSLQSNIIKEKTKKTNLLKYNTEIPSQNNNIKEKIKAKNIVTKQITSKKYWSDILKLNIEDIDYNNDNELIISNYCIKHNSFIINRSLLKNRIRENIENICTQCNPINENVSIKENEIRDHIKNELNINTEKIRINNKEIDIYLSDYKLGIEFDGLYWHSELFKDKNYHLNKTEECKKQGIQLLHIFEDEWSNKKEIVKSIIRNKLNVTDNKIFARKCQIKEINHDTSSIFLNENHIQGNINTSIRLGLFYNKKLVSIMTFGKKRIALGNKITNESEYEMLRFCNKLNAHVIGGAGKLLSYFIKTYNPKSILTYADRRYSNGNLYEQLGFKFIKNTKPNYWYYNNKTKKCKRYYRYSFRKNILIKNGYDPNKTENQIMNENGYLKIYDCGHMKFEMNFNYV